MAADRLAPRQKKRQGATRVFWDESGFSLTPYAAKTWAPRGQPPVLLHGASWTKLSAISAITTRGRLYFTLHRGSIRTPQVLRFLRHLLRHCRGWVVLLWDRAPIHRSRAVARLLQAYRARLEAVLLPPYAPDLNPDEWAWAHLKCRELANHTAPDTLTLQHAIRCALRRMRRRPALIRSFMKGAALSW